MPNPSGPYPGRQVFLGLTSRSKPCFAYLVTGRSPESRQRKAVMAENSVRIGPLGAAAYDPLRHYNAVKFDNASGVLAVTNGIQTDAIYEAYKLLRNVQTAPTSDYLQKILEGANAEPDSLNTPRIAGVICPQAGSSSAFIGIKAAGALAAASEVKVKAGSLRGVSVYQGDIDSPKATNPAAQLSEIDFLGGTASELAKYVYDMSAADYKGDDIRVCAVAGVFSEGAWSIATINRS